jgi:hypothetical protein
MKKLIAAAALLTSTLSFAGTTVVWVRGNSAAEVEAKMMNKVQEINRTRRVRGQNCEGAKVYGASGASMSYRVNRFGELEEQWTATIKVSCRNDN